MTQRTWKETFLILFLFSTAMAYIESSIVVYLRMHFYPEGFAFPLKVIPNDVLIIEVIRELATLVILGTVAWLAGSTVLERSSYFVFSFGVWDILYYVFLKLTIGWPSTLFDWDILFLIPLPWVGPVLAPVLVSVGFIVSSFILGRMSTRGIHVRFTWYEMLGVVLGCSVIVISFLMHVEEVKNYRVPTTFHWTIFSIGYLLSGISFLHGIGVAKKGGKDKIPPTVT